MLIGCVVAGLQRAEGCHLDGLGSGQNVHQPEAAADDECAPEQRLDLLRRRVGGEVEVLRHDAEQQVAHRAADDEGLEAGLLQPARDLQRTAADLVARRIGWSFGPINAWTRGVLAGYEAREQAADHRRESRRGAICERKTTTRRRPRWRRPLERGTLARPTGAPCIDAVQAVEVHGVPASAAFAVLV